MKGAYVIDEFGPRQLGGEIEIREEYGRPYRWMEKKPRKPRRDRNPLGQRPSELARGRGASTQERHGLVLCPGRGRKIRDYSLHRPLWRRDSAQSEEKVCGEPILFMQGQKSARCRKCGRRHWLAGLPVIYQHDDLRVVRCVIAGIHGWVGSGKSFVPTLHFKSWGGRAEAKIGMDVFYDHLPWNLTKS